ncbi:hypothetical protein FCL40_07330 [Ferrimonas sediminicola]|uniref:Uncharacterized protein n=1 Tax=Ferrimonas sediminicola TaxID=2569538 RepID=A0A4U1BFC1_9GAMM|nr:hypothetical protein [Ferrimonas sediminicola]TKB49954.1 hypothetical protein FCL40_07330 [Ferrimonas sediminicola]
MTEPGWVMAINSNKVDEGALLVEGMTGEVLTGAGSELLAAQGIKDGVLSHAAKTISGSYPVHSQPITVNGQARPGLCVDDSGVLDLNDASQCHQTTLPHGWV